MIASGQEGREKAGVDNMAPPVRHRAGSNMDPSTVVGFGQEWQSFDQSKLDDNERREIFSDYFRIFPWQDIKRDAVGFDLGCGSGRWAREVAPRVGHLHCIDASSAAVEVARRNLRQFPNCTLHVASVDAIPLADMSMDFGYSLGMLHHLPDPLAALRECARRLKPGAPLLIYVYYALDQRPSWFRAIWRATDVCRRGISRLPFPVRYAVSQAIAVGVYWPLARLARAGDALGFITEGWPLSSYRRRSFYTMRTDALDRFGTRLEGRFRADVISGLMCAAGFHSVRFSDRPPFWCAVGIRD